MPDVTEFAGMIGVAILFGSFFGFVIPGGSIVGAAAGAGVLAVLAIIYLVVVPQDRIDRSDVELPLLGGRDSGS